jgi:aspartate carbamoyltransferase catalytic subunit
MAEIVAEAERVLDAQPELAPPIAGNPTGKNLLSIHQLTPDDLAMYIEEARVAESIVRDPERRGISVLPFTVLKAVMRQPSTRTGGSMTTAMVKLGGAGELISGMQGSSEAKGESLEHSWVAFDTQTDIVGIRTQENDGPYLAARAIAESFGYSKLWQKVPVINLGNGTDEHPTQAIGDAVTMAKWQGWDPAKLAGKTVAMVGDHERYRAFHSDMYVAKLLGMNVIAVQSEVAEVPEDIARHMGESLTTKLSLDKAMQEADVLIVGRNPDEYTGDDEWEQLRSRWLADSYRGWVIDRNRLQQMNPNSIVLHPRPIKDELHKSVEDDPRMWDVDQMAVMIGTRMAIIARHMGVSIAKTEQGRKAFPRRPMEVVRIPVAA